MTVFGDADKTGRCLQTVLMLAIAAQLCYETALEENTSV